MFTYCHYFGRGYGHTGKWIEEKKIMKFCCCFKVNWAKRLKNCQTSSRWTPSPNAHWLAQCNRLRNLIGSEIWNHACVFCTTLLLPSTATHAIWNSKCCCQQQKNKSPWPQVHKFWTKVYSQKWGWQLCEYAGLYLAQSVCLCGGVDTDEDELGLHDCLVHVRGEEEVAPPAGLHHLVQTRLKQV